MNKRTIFLSLTFLVVLIALVGCTKGNEIEMNKEGTIIVQDGNQNNGIANKGPSSNVNIPGRSLDDYDNLNYGVELEIENGDIKFTYFRNCNSESSPIQIVQIDWTITKTEFADSPLPPYTYDFTDGDAEVSVPYDQMAEYDIEIMIHTYPTSVSGGQSFCVQPIDDDGEDDFYFCSGGAVIDADGHLCYGNRQGNDKDFGTTFSIVNP